MCERSGVITFQGQPLTLLGNEIKTGEPAPEFTALDNALGEVSLADFRGKVVVISSVPSLDTPVCDTQTRRFNEQAASLGDDVVILTISMDLPFAQARWCGAAGVEAVKTLSDHRDASFAQAFGLLIKELRLLTRAAVVVDRAGVVRYAQIAGEITDELDYDAVTNAVREIL